MCGSQVCEVSGSIASLAVSRPGTARDQPVTEQPAARCRCHQRRPASRALIAMRLTPPSFHVTVNYRNKTTAFLVEDTHCDTRHALSMLPCPWGDPSGGCC
ncbi:unnamed protein product [Pleuronectes platessa]|uniref:Uncharacterized protein n=1 Tax=Pleuronectes platessa TaxID=8262 RepID=A0A9N7UHY8_PLEPL|nr:unnamed protein product [Pleuronectes platessa]